MKLLRTLLAVALMLSFGTVAFAHDMWLEARGEKVWLMYGHPGATDPYPIDRITALSGWTPNNWQISLTPVYHKGEAYAWLNDDFTMLTVEFDNKYWYNTEEDGWRNFLAPQEVRGKILDEGRSYKLSKNILTWMPEMNKPVGQRAELVPLKDPTKLKEGDMLPVVMYYEGKPIFEGARISGTSDSSIEHPELISLKNTKPFNVKIGPAGHQIIVGKIERRLDDTRRVWYAFSLSFKTRK